MDQFQFIKKVKLADLGKFDNTHYNLTIVHTQT